MLPTARPRIPSRDGVTYRFVYSAGEFSSATTSQNFTAVGIPANWAVRGVRIQNLTGWSGTSLSSLNVQVGTSANPSQYATPMELTGTITSASLQTSAAFAEAQATAHDIVVRFVSSGCSMNALASGSVEISLRIEPL